MLQNLLSRERLISSLYTGRTLAEEVALDLGLVRLIDGDVPTLGRKTSLFVFKSFKEK